MASHAPTANSAPSARAAAAVLPPREQALFDYAVALAAVPPQADHSHIEALRDVGLTDLEIIDLTLSAAVFCWANRLMETLGEPVARTAD